MVLAIWWKKILGQSNLVEKRLGHSHLEPKHTGAQPFRANILGHSSLEKKYIGTQLFRAKNILGHSYLEATHTGTQLFRGKTYWN